MYEYIEFIICYGEGITPEMVKEKTRIGDIVFTRQLIMYFCVKFKVGTLTYIGSLLGEKDHATVLHSLKTINNYIETDRQKKAKIDYYQSLIKKILSLSKKTEDMKDILKPLEKQISELEQRCINLTLQVAFIKNKVALETVK